MMMDLALFRSATDLHVYVSLCPSDIRKRRGRIFFPRGRAWQVSRLCFGEVVDSLQSSVASTWEGIGGRGFCPGVCPFVVRLSEGSTVPTPLARADSLAAYIVVVLLMFYYVSKTSLRQEIIRVLLLN